MQKILVIGGTGTTGRRIIGRLRAAGIPVRTASRAGGDVRLDLGDPATFEPALDGVSAVYLMEPDLRPVSDPRVRVPGLAARAAGAGVRRLVLLSAYGVGEADDRHPLRAAEQAVRDSGLDWTILRPDWFAQNFSETFWRPGIMAGTLALPTGDGRTPFVDADDIAEVAAAALTEEGHSGQTYQLTGPRALTFGEAAGLIGAATGRAVRHIDVDPGAFTERRIADGVPADVARRLTDLLVAVRDGRGSPVSDGVPRALGRPARRFEDHVAAAAAGGHWS